MAGELQPLANNFAIVDANGNPTQYFIKWAQQRQIDIGAGINLLQAQALIDEWAAARSVNAGTGLNGGGTLDNDVTINSNGVTIQQDGVDVATAIFVINFTGTGVIVTQTDPITVEVNITGGGPPPPPPPGPSHSYWRMRSFGCVSSQIIINELEMAATAAGPNLCTGGTAISTGAGDWSAAANAFDGSLANYGWGNNADIRAWLGYHFATPVSIDEFRVAPSSILTAAPALFVVESSDDGITWTFEWYCQWSTPTFGTLTSFKRPVVQASNTFWGILNFYCANGASTFDMYETEFYMNTVVGVDTTPVGGAPFASRLPSGSYPLSQSFDNNLATGTYLPPPTDNFEVILGYEFAVATTIVEFTIYCDTGGNNIRAPGSGFAVYSQDGLSFLPAGSYGPFSTADYTGNSNHRTFPVTP